MEHKDELLVLYIDRENKCFHQVLLNSLELSKIGTEIANIFAAKNSAVRVNSTKLKIYEEEKNGKESSR